MRLWHQTLIPIIPRAQLWGQHRECTLYADRDGAGRTRRLITFLLIRPTNSIYITR